MPHVHTLHSHCFDHHPSIQYYVDLNSICLQALKPSDLMHKVWRLLGGHRITAPNGALHISFTQFRKKNGFVPQAPRGWPPNDEGGPLQTFSGEQAPESCRFLNDYQSASHVPRCKVDPDLVHQEIRKWENGETPPVSNYPNSKHKKCREYYEAIYSCYQLKASC